MENSAETSRGVGSWLTSVAGSFWGTLCGHEEVTATHHPDGGPGRILLMRHAEKTGKTDDIYLSKEGVKRAERLVTYIPQVFGRPDFIYAAARSKRSIRSIEPVNPLAAVYLNRLSDLLFVLARVLNRAAGGVDVLWLNEHRRE